MKCREMRRLGLQIGMNDQQRKKVREEGKRRALENAEITLASERLRLRMLEMKADAEAEARLEAKLARREVKMALKRINDIPRQDFPPTDRAFVTRTTPDGFRTVRLDGSNLKVSVFDNPAAVVRSVFHDMHFTRLGKKGEGA